MKAMVMESLGTENLRLKDLPDPRPGPGEVLVRLRAASLNFRDVLALRGGYGSRQKTSGLIPLSVAFIGPDGRILNILDMEPQTVDIHPSEGPAAYALETNRGWFAERGIRRGARVEGLESAPPPE